MGKKHAKPKKINLALQGGGAHGAYTWGVLDRLLEDEDIIIDGISGTSAGAINAAVMITGFMEGGPKGGKKALENFWFRISETAAFSPTRQMPWEKFYEGYNLDLSPGYNFMDMLSRIFSPYELNPLNINPLKTVLEEFINPDHLQACSVIKLFACATSVTTGQPRVFDCSEINVDVLLASACLPFLYQAVELNGDYYWDGGFMGNPLLDPLIDGCFSSDIILVQINPIVREGLPVRAHEIINRLNEISFNSSLISEMRLIDFVSKMVKENKLEKSLYRNLRMHLIFSPKEMHDLNPSSKMNASWEFLQYLRAIGRAAADSWLKKNFNKIGVESSLDIEEIYMCQKKPAARSG